MDGDGIRNGFATSASDASTAAIATAIVTSQSTIVRHGCGIHPCDLSRNRTAPG